MGRGMPHLFRRCQIAYVDAMKGTVLLLAVFVTLVVRAPEPPVARATAHLFYFPPLGAPILIDGYEKMDEAPLKSEVWRLKNNKWEIVAIADHDSRKLTAAAFNSDRNEVFVFGGVGKDGYDFKKSDGLVFDGRSWTIVTTNQIGSRDHHEMVYANHLKAYVMYGGVDELRTHDSTTWLFRDGKWTSLSIAGPGKRVHHAMAYDPVRGKVVLYGGGPGGERSDTWSSTE